MRTFKSVHWRKSRFNNLRTRTLKNVFTNHLVWLKYSRERNWRRYSVMKGYIRWSSSTMRKTMSIMYQKEHWRKMFRIKGCTVSKVVFHKRWRFRWRFQHCRNSVSSVCRTKFGTKYYPKVLLKAMVPQINRLTRGEDYLFMQDGVIVYHLEQLTSYSSKCLSIACLKIYQIPAPFLQNIAKCRAKMRKMHLIWKKFLILSLNWV